MFPTSNMNMIIDLVNDLFKKNCNNFDEVRGHSLVFSAHYPKILSLSSSEYNKNYTIRVQRESDKIVENDPVTISDNS